MMKEDGCSVMSVGFFSWARLGPEEGGSEFASPDNVSVTMRCDKENRCIFILNFNDSPQTVETPFGYEFLSGEMADRRVFPCGAAVLKSPL